MQRSSLSALALETPAEVDPVVEPGPALTAPNVAQKVLQLRVVIRDIGVHGGITGSGASVRADGIAAAGREWQRESRPLGISRRHLVESNLGDRLLLRDTHTVRHLIVNVSHLVVHRLSKTSSYPGFAVGARR